MNSGFDLIASMRAGLESAGDEVRRRQVRLTLSTPARAVRIGSDAHDFRVCFLQLLLDTVQALPDGAALRIDVRSDDTHARVSIGSTALLLPLSKPPPTDADTPLECAASRSHADGPLAGLNVLVADDSRDAANGLAALLRLSGARASAVFGGQAAIDAILRLGFDAVVLDLDMPDLDGCEVARRIRQHERVQGRDAAVKLVALTGATHDDDRRFAHDAGFDHHLGKPLDIHALTAALIGQPPG